MMELSYRRHRFPPVVIQHACWLYLRFTLSYRDVEAIELPRGRGRDNAALQKWNAILTSVSQLTANSCQLCW